MFELLDSRFDQQINEATTLRVSQPTPEERGLGVRAAVACVRSFRPDGGLLIPWVASAAILRLPLGWVGCQAICQRAKRPAAPRGHLRRGLTERCTPCDQRKRAKTRLGVATSS